MRIEHVGGKNNIYETVDTYNLLEGNTALPR